MTTNNNDLAVRSYVPQYKALLPTVFTAKAAFSGAFAEMQVVDGISHTTKAFSVKTTATPVVIGTYDKSENSGGFGDGTGGSRFGKMTEIKYLDTDANYDHEWAIHEGLDRHTVNNDLNTAVLDRLNLQAQAQVRDLNRLNGKFLSNNAGSNETLADFSDSNIVKLFNTISKYYSNNEVSVAVKAYVNADLYNALVDLASNTTAKNSSVSIDDNGVVKYKGFYIEETTDSYFVAGDYAYFAPDDIAIPFMGIETARTKEADEFDGIKLQGAGKDGRFILDDNKKAVVKVTAPKG
ncbi:phage capsid protein [Leuconostoc fallax]|uniref:phage capsid protein n=1 Tax=Leuconostoc fallax TaxID=1251 RepID=UPI001C1EC280|nr:phage capsid protein [Leuconostoc fallax]MBU7455848.1 phage capsid protein [Leuconostoc fallax]